MERVILHNSSRYSRVSIKETGVEFFERIEKYCIENLQASPTWFNFAAVQIPKKEEDM